MLCEALLTPQLPVLPVLCSGCRSWWTSRFPCASGVCKERRSMSVGRAMAPLHPLPKL